MKAHIAAVLVEALLAGQGDPAGALTYLDDQRVPWEDLGYGFVYCDGRELVAYMRARDELILAATTKGQTAKR